MSRKQYGLGEYIGYEKGYRDGWNRGYDSGASGDTFGLAIGLGVAAVAGVAGFIAGRPKWITYTCRRCGINFKVQKGKQPKCPCRTQNDYDNEDW